MLASIIGDKWRPVLFVVGLVTLLFGAILIGWVISIYWGVLILRKSLEAQV